MIVRAARLIDVHDVLSSLSAQNRAELDALGLNDWRALKHVRAFMEAGKAWTLWMDGNPAFVFGIFTYREEEFDTWFIATAAYFDLGARGVLYTRKLLKELAEPYGVLYTTTLSQHPDVMRWFELLGYEKVYENGGKLVLRYVTKSAASVSFLNASVIAPEVVAPVSP